MKVYLDGQFVQHDDARLSLFDAGVQHAVGLFETMRAWGGNILDLDRHVQRLVASARELGLSDQLRPQPLSEAVHLTLTENAMRDARLRLTVTGGDLSLLSSGGGRGGGEPERDGSKGGGGGHRPSIFITASEPTRYPPAFFEKGVTVTLADPKANPFDPTAGHKALNYWSRLQSLARAAGVGAGEALWFSITNHLVGGAVSNALLVKDDQLITPIARGEEPQGAVPSPVLPGVTRRAVLETAENELGIRTQKRMITIDDVLSADELMLTNSSWLVLPVVAVEKQRIGTGEPGTITRRLRSALVARASSP